MSSDVPKRVRPNLESRSRVGSERDLEVLSEIAWAGILSTSQICRLHFPSRRRTQRRLRALLDHGLVRAHLQGEALHRENIYTLTPLGVDRLFEVGAFPDGPPRVFRIPRPQKLGHALAVREVFVALRMAEREDRLRLTDFRFEEELAGGWLGRDAGLIPDGLAVVERSGSEQVLVLEVDLGTETSTTLRPKLAAYRRAFDCGLGYLGSATTRLLVAAVSEPRSATLLRLSTEAGLGDRGRVVLLDALPDFIRAWWPHEPAARPDRTERSVTEPQALGSATFSPIR